MTGPKELIADKVNSEQGSAMTEFAFVIPILALLLFGGYNLMRNIEVSMLKRDIVRSLSQSYLCSFKQGDVAKVCYQNAVSPLIDFAKGRYVLNNGKVEDERYFNYSVNTYSLDESSMTAAELARMNSVRRNGCDSNVISEFPVKFINGVTSTNFTSSKYDPIYVRSKVENQNQPTLVRHLFTSYSVDSQAMKVICENGIITISEVHVQLPGFLAFFPGSGSTGFYDYSYL